MALTDIAANSEGATTTERVVVRVRADYTGPIVESPSAKTIMRVSPIYEAVTATDAFGRPNGGRIVQTSEIVEPWGRIAVYISGQDVTYFRGAAISINTLSLQRLGNYEAAEFDIHTVSVFEEFGTGDLAWLQDSAEVRVVRIHPDGTTSTKFLGTINGISPSGDNIGIKLTAHGLLFDATYRVTRPPVRVSTDAEAEDLGVAIARSLNAAQGLWSAVEPVTTGVSAIKSPSWETGVDYVKALLALAVTDAGNAWTVWLDDQARASIIQTHEIPGAKTVTVVAGQDGVVDGLNHDTVSGITTIYGQGVNEYGVAWRNVKFPRTTSAAPRYPLDNLDESLAEGSTNYSTITRSGVSTAQLKLYNLGYSVDPNGKFKADTTAALQQFQADRGLTVTGTINAATWSSLFGILDIGAGADIFPLATLPVVQPRLYNSNGVDTGPNPAYNAAVRPLERHIDFGNGVSLEQAQRYAAGILARDGQRPTEGDLTLTVCPQECSRFDISPGDTVIYKGHHGADLTLLVHRVEWSSDLSVKLTVSTRDMDYSELDAAMNRIRQANAGLTTASPASAVSMPVSFSSGIAGMGGFATPAPTVSGGGGITGVTTISGVYTITSADVDTLMLVDVSGISATIVLPGFPPVGSQIHFSQIGSTGANTVTFMGQGSSSTVASFNGRRLAGLYASTTAIKVSATEWILVGAMAT